ncbi:hypothetical protein J2S03_000617 [Alicyclobacillus cycloheptanicus]|uniref:Uncharacterized protein n=1 Tax=Alicyclobacillus cycloheptanicus TaxID=1457 RepID=A0ABT9XEV4_9BACL|nr:hypothetical protein [Alicyclobacillus cycloheptanicus]
MRDCNGAGVHGPGVLTGPDGGPVRDGGADGDADGGPDGGPVRDAGPVRDGGAAGAGFQCARDSAARGLVQRRGFGILSSASTLMVPCPLSL